MIARHLAPLRARWQSQPRLRLAGLVAVLLLGLHLVFALADRREALQAAWRQDAQLYARLESASRDDAWPERLARVRSGREAVEASLPVAASEGLAQAELQAWLGQQAQAARLDGVRIQAQQAIAVPGRDDLWQVVARLDAQADAATLAGVLQRLGQARPWTQVERIEVRGESTRQLNLVVRAYFRRGDAPEAAAVAGGVGP